MYNKILAFIQNNKEKIPHCNSCLFLKLPFKLTKNTLKNLIVTKKAKIEKIMHFLTVCNGILTSAKNDVEQQWIKCQ